MFGVEIATNEPFRNTIPSELEETFVDAFKRVPGIENRTEGVNFSEHIRNGQVGAIL